MSSVTGDTREIELPGGKLLTVSRFDTSDGRTAIQIAAGWPEQLDPTGAGADFALPLPGDVAGDLIEALQELFPDTSGGTG